MIRKLLIKKNSGNIPSIIYGQIFMMLIIIWAMFQFRLILLNTTFEYIDDALTTSLLGGALINTEEYGKSNQVVAHDNDVYSDVSSGTSLDNGWEPNEAMILVSQLNYNSDILLQPSEMQQKTKLNVDFRDTKTYLTLQSNGEPLALPLESTWESDYYMRRVVSTFSDNINYNLSNGQKQGENSASNIVPALNNGVDKIFSIKEALTTSFLSRFLSGEIKVVRFEIFDIYRRNLAQRMVYYSNYMLYEGHYLKYYYSDADKLEKVNYMPAGSITWGGHEPTTEEQFSYLYEPCKYEFKNNTIAKDYAVKKYQESTLSKKRKLTGITGSSGATGTTGFINKLPDSYYKTNASGKKVLNPDYAKEWEKFVRMRARWRADHKFFELYGSKPYIYIDTEQTFQGLADLNGATTGGKRIPYYKYYFVDNNTDDSTMAINNVKNGDVAEIHGYGHWKYTDTFEGPDGPDNAVGVSNSQSYSYTETNGKPTVDYGSNPARQLDNTSFLAEIAFSIEVFPTMQSRETYVFNEWSYKTVSVERLVDISSN